MDSIEGWHNLQSWDALITMDYSRVAKFILYRFFVGKTAPATVAFCRDLCGAVDVAIMIPRYF